MSRPHGKHNCTGKYGGCLGAARTILGKVNTLINISYRCFSIWGIPKGGFVSDTFKHARVKLIFPLHQIYYTPVNEH